MDLLDMDLDIIRNLSNTELGNYSSSLKRRHDLIKAEINRRLLLLFPELTPYELNATSPVMKILILERFGDKDGNL